MKKPDRSFIHDNAAALALQVLSLIISLGSFYVVARRLGSDDYGLYVGIYALLFPISGLTYQGSSRSFVQMRRQADIDEPIAVRRFLDAGVPLLLMGAVAAVAAGVAIFGSRALVPLILLVTTELLLSAATDVVISIEVCRNGYASAFYYQFMSLTGRFATLVAVVVFPIDSITSITAIACGSLVVSIVVYMSVRPLPDFRIAGPQHRRKKDLSSSLLMGVDLFAVGVQTDADKVVLAGGSHKDVSGVYAVAYKLVQLSLMPVNSMLDATHYRMVASARYGRKNTIRQTLKLSGLALAYAVVAFPIMWVLLDHVWRVMGDEYRETTEIGRSLLFVLVLRAPAILPLNALLAYGMVATRTIISSSAAAVALILYIALIPNHSWRGAVVGTLVSEGLLLVTAWIVLLRASGKEPTAVPAGLAEAEVAVAP